VPILCAADASGAPPWVDRTLTLPGGDWAFDVGLGVAHDARDDSGGGFNLEMGVGIIDRLELGVRTGLRFGDPAERSLQGDRYGRLFDRQTLVDSGSEVFANPELRVRGALVREHVFELALEGRLVLPFEPGTNAGLLFGVPLAFHLGDRVRLDMGAYVPVIFNRPVADAVSLPLDVWIQVTPRLWLGPMTGLYFQQPGDRAVTLWSLGFGLGYQFTRFLDLKTAFLFPDLNNDSRAFGVGVGIQIRIE
jgi:hypothetical protein